MGAHIRSVGRSGVCSHVTIVLVCNFINIIYIYFKKRGGLCSPLIPLLIFWGGGHPLNLSAALFGSITWVSSYGKRAVHLRLHVANYFAGSMSI